MSTHRAVAITAVGSLKVIDLPTPTPGHDEVLIHVRYATLIPFDEYQLDTGFALSEGDYPHVVGFASAGYVKAVGENVKDLKEGDRVRAAFTLPSSCLSNLTEGYRLQLPGHEEQGRAGVHSRAAGPCCEGQLAYS